MLKKIEKLTWQSLEQWASPKIVERGQNYQKNVMDLAITPDDALIAKVSGRDLYVTRVWMSGNRLHSECSCPYGSECKHAVAVVLTYLSHVKNKKPVPRWDQDEYEAFQLVYMDEAEHELDVEQLEKQLKKMTKAQLIEWVMDTCQYHPELYAALPVLDPPSTSLLKSSQNKSSQKASASSAKKTVDKAVKKTVATLKQQILKTTDERGWRSWGGDGYTPDYTAIEKGLDALLQGQHWQAVIDLWAELWPRGHTQAMESDDEGDTGNALCPSLDRILVAVDESDWPQSDKVLWYWQACLEDDISLLEGLTQPFTFKSLKKADWLAVAEALISQLDSTPKQRIKEANWSTQYRRGRLLEYAVQALDRAGDQARSRQLQIDELPYCENYIGLVDHCLNAKDETAAEHWIYAGIKATSDTAPGIAAHLQRQLHALATLRNDWKLAAAMELEAFWDRPCIDRYKPMVTAIKKARLWGKLQAPIIEALASAQSPLAKGSDDWSLPILDFSCLQQPPSNHARVDFSLLIEISLFEKKPTQAMAWYQKAMDQKARLSSYVVDRLATAVQKQRPAFSMQLWQQRAAELIDQVKPSAYVSAMHYVKLIQKLSKQLGQEKSFASYIAQLRADHKPKRRLMAELDAFDPPAAKQKLIVKD